jgi:hypothetical protein
MDGLLMFLKYAFAPNVLKFCGPSDTGSLFDGLKEKDLGREMRELLLKFSGALPYLQLIAQKNAIKDIFDPKVVEAYWLGNDLLKNVSAKDIFGHTEERFRNKMDKKDWSWLVSGSIPQAKPFHAFHVFDIYRRAGLIQSGMKVNILETMDKCRISWSKVVSVDLTKNEKDNLSFGTALVEYNPLEFSEKKLILGNSTTREVYLINSQIKKGDEVSIHWDYVCDKLTPYQKNNLMNWTNYHLNLTNKTI